MTTAKGRTSQPEDMWVASACGMCSSHCSILVHRLNGIVSMIEGNPKSPLGMGRLCPGGPAGIQLLYDPYRVDRPLKRANPEKGIGVDPCWQEISWDEALSIIIEKLGEVRAEDPRKLFLCGTPVSLSALTFALGVFMPAFGSPNGIICEDHHGGNAQHIMARRLHASTATHHDVAYCDYLLIFGCETGLADYYAFTTMTQKMADARVRGMKLVTVAPYMGPAAEKADEWLPIRPGSEGALACAFLNLLLNEYGLYDAEYICRHTDGPYLVGPDAYYARDQAFGKPLVWDAADGKAKPFDEAVQDAAIDGSYAVEGRECKPVFQLLKERVSKWTPEATSEVSTIPPETIRRVAREFGEAARIGSTILIEEQELPHRPAAATCFAGACAHDNAWLTSLAIELLNQVVGASDVPGGLLGCNPLSCGHPQTGMPCWAPQADADGLLLPTEPQRVIGDEPAEYARFHDWRGLGDWPITTCLTPLAAAVGDRSCLDHPPEVLINCGSNLLMSEAGPEANFEAFKNCFVISFNLFSDETAEALADIVLPDACYLERLDTLPNWLGHGLSAGMGDWAYQISQPVVEPLYERRHFCEVLLEIGQRMGFSEEMNVRANLLYGLKPPHLLNPEREYSWQQIADSVCKSWFGAERGLGWFKENGVLTWPKRLEESYWRPFDRARVPLYHEWVPAFGERIKQIAGERMGEIDTSCFLPLPDWRPCQAFQPQPGYDLQAIRYEVPWQTFSQAHENPWLQEVGRSEPYSHFICVNSRTASDKGISDGDPIWLESIEGRRLKGRARLTEAIHPQVVAVAGDGGHWAQGMPLARDRGVFINSLLTFDPEHMDLVTLTVDGDARAKVYKA